mmetsp:Transcript_8644/g.10203  ORF Transcript_8644/g.10203 Transcript_8644/m.10203 type:complete len:135 (+) Transcript_8644:102-506(+)
MASATQKEEDNMKLKAISSNVEVALKELGSYHKYVDEVTEYGHSVYLEHNKMEGFEETKEYAHNILCTLALHVHVVAANLTEHLNLQSIELAKLDVEAKTAESVSENFICIVYLNAHDESDPIIVYKYNYTIRD